MPSVSARSCAAGRNCTVLRAGKHIEVIGTETCVRCCLKLVFKHAQAHIRRRESQLIQQAVLKAHLRQIRDRSQFDWVLLNQHKATSMWRPTCLRNKSSREASSMHTMNSGLERSWYMCHHRIEDSWPMNACAAFPEPRNVHRRLAPIEDADEPLLGHVHVNQDVGSQS